MKHIARRVLMETLIEGWPRLTEISVSFTRTVFFLPQFSCFRWKSAYKSLHGREEPCQIRPTVSQLGQQGRLEGGRQEQSRVQIIRQGRGDEAGPRLIHSSDAVTVTKMNIAPCSCSSSVIKRQDQGQAGNWVQGWRMNEACAPAVAGKGHISDNSSGRDWWTRAAVKWRLWGMGKESPGEAGQGQ